MAAQRASLIPSAAREDSELLIAAGGAGGYYEYNSFANASVDEWAHRSFSIKENNMDIRSGGAADHAGGGAGYLKNGETCSGLAPAKSFRHGLKGGIKEGVSGGFGGGGAAKWCAGGGGYTGGHAGSAQFGGGGGSFVDQKCTQNSKRLSLGWSGNGKVFITKLPI